MTFFDAFIRTVVCIQYQAYIGWGFRPTEKSLQSADRMAVFLLEMQAENEYWGRP